MFLRNMDYASTHNFIEILSRLGGGGSLKKKEKGTTRGSSEEAWNLYLLLRKYV